MEVIYEPGGEETNEISKQIQEILSIEPSWHINGEKGVIVFHPSDLTDVYPFVKICHDEGVIEYDFVFWGSYIFEKELPEDMTPDNLETWKSGGYRVTRKIGVEGMIPGEHDEIKKHIWEILKNQPEKIMNGKKGKIICYYAFEDILIEEKNEAKDPDSNTEYRFIFPVAYIPDGR